MPIRYAKLASSPRLQRFLKVLERGGEWSTREIMLEAHVCAVNSCAAELREQGIPVECSQRAVHGRQVWFYKLGQGQQQLPL